MKAPARKWNVLEATGTLLNELGIMENVENYQLNILQLQSFPML